MAFLAVADPTWFLGLLVDDHYVADVDRRLLVHDPSGLRASRSLVDLGVALDHVHALDMHALPGGVDRDHFALDALVTTGDDDHRVTLFDLHVTAPPVRARCCA